MGFFSAFKKFFGQETDAPPIKKESELGQPTQDTQPQELEQGLASAPLLEQKQEAAPSHGETVAAQHGEQAEAAAMPAAGDSGSSAYLIEPIKSHSESCDDLVMEADKAEPPSKRAFGADAGTCTHKNLPETPPAVEDAAPGAAGELEQPQNCAFELAAGEAEKATEYKNASGRDPEEEALLLRLRGAEPRLSQWLDIVLEGEEKAGESFWRKLKFLLRSLEAPENEIEAFAADFASWLGKMEYDYLDEFRSELQYRLALALDLEDEEDERNRLLVKLGAGLAATRERLGRSLDALFSGHRQLDDAFWEEMEELFIMADMGYDAAVEIVARLKKRSVAAGVGKPEDARLLLLDELDEIFRAQPRIRGVNRPEVVLMIGVNGAGKTTTIAKLAYRERMRGKKVLIVAADTFRAAAIEQLQVWADRAGAEFFARAPGADPASVVWEGMDYALKHDIDTVFVDTAGRLQTRVNLMEELGKIRQVLGKKHPGSPHRSMLVLDATTGQNALSQAKLFREAAGADEIVLTKLDGTAKGGVAIAVAMKERLPITYIGLGEKMEDLRPFNGRDFARAILGEENGSVK